MVNRVYLLDSNIVIKIWREYPDLFNDIKNHGRIDFKISHNVARELSKKEFKNVDGVPVLTSKFIELLDHIISEDSCKTQGDYRPFYSIEGNKISKNDYELICICKSNENYILVTEDKRLFDSGKLLLEDSKVIGFNGFLELLDKSNIWGQL